MFWDLLYKLKALFCRHEYIFYAPPYYLDITGYYACRKCGKLSNNPPEKLIVKEKK